MFNKLVVKEGKLHRDLYVPYFSKTNVVKLEYLIKEQLAKFMGKLDDAHATGKSVDLTLEYRCLVADTLMTYCYDKPFGAIEAEDFAFPMM
jgi:hypothetical protein